MALPSIRNRRGLTRRPPAATIAGMHTTQTGYEHLLVERDGDDRPR